jgi:hypothetical protein
LDIGEGLSNISGFENNDLDGFGEAALLTPGSDYCRFIYYFRNKLNP